MTPLDRLLLVRQGGAVERAHTTPHHGSYSVAAHSWGVAQIILALHPEPSLRLVRAALDHDVTERWLGDLPSQLFDKSLTLRAMVEDAHLEAAVRIWGTEGEPLSAIESHWLRSADSLELLLWAFDQAEMGNGAVEKMIERLRARFRQLAREKALPDPLVAALADLFERREEGWELDSDLP